MSRTIKSILFGLLFCSGFLSCEKEYSIEMGLLPGNSGTAVFNLNGSPGACTAPIINGSYTVGTAMSTANTVSLTVNVTTTGTYTISTSQVNGVYFTTTGVFSVAGIQTIQLTANGTPAAAGTFTYTPGTAGCAFGITFTTVGSNTGTAVYTCTSMNATGTYTAGSTLGTSNTLVLNVNVTTAGTYSLNTGTVNNFSFSGSGTLALGSQTIILAGSGVPSSSATVTFSIGTGCNAIITVGGTSGNFLRGTIGGTATQFNSGLAGKINNVSAGPSDLSIDGKLAAIGNDELAVDFFNNTGLITIGTYANGSSANPNKFGEITYIDNAGNLYAPNPASASAATFNLSTLTATGATGTFTGTVTIFDPVTLVFGTATKVITTGSFSITF